MSASSSNSSRAVGAFTVTVSGDPRFVEPIRSLTHRAAETDGCSHDDAMRLADAVERVLATLLGPGHALLAGGAMDVTFEPLDGAFSVEIRVPAPAMAEGGGTLERSLAARGNLDAVRSLVPATEFGSAGSHQFCRMACLHQGPS
jgi:hypothetical protein